MKPVKAWAVVSKRGRLKDVYFSRVIAEDWAEQLSDENNGFKVVPVLITCLK